VVDNKKVIYFKIASNDDFECSPHKEMINEMICQLTDLINEMICQLTDLITHCVLYIAYYTSTECTVSHKDVQFMW
jgi:hypothetical protein